METALTKLLTEYGFGVAMAATIVLIFISVLRWIANSTSKREEQLFKLIDEQRITFQTILDGLQKALSEHTEQAKEFHKTMMTANEYQRREHEKIISLIEGMK